MELANDTAFVAYSPGEYRVEVTSPAYCIKMSEAITVIDTCLIEFRSPVPYGIYQNPTTGEFIIECIDPGSCNKTYSIAIFDMRGNLMQQMAHQHADAPKRFGCMLEQGLYIMKIKEDDGPAYQLPLIIAY